MMEAQKIIPELRFPEFINSWNKRKISNLLKRYANPVSVIKNKYYHEIGLRSHGKGIFYKKPTLGSSLGNKRVFWIKENAFILNIVFAWEQAIAITNKDQLGMIASHRFPMYLSKDNNLYLSFFLHYLLTPKGKNLLMLASPGGAGRNKTLGQEAFNKSEMYVPYVKEQQKIADFLSAVDDKLQALKKKKELLEQYKKGVMQKIFSQEIRFRPALSAVEGDENGMDFPDWEEKKLGDIGDTYNGLTGKTKEDFGEGKPFIQYKQIFDNTKIDMSNCGYVKIEENDTQNKAKYGDVFFTTSSETPGEVGYSSVLLEEVDDLYLNSFCFGYRIKSFNVLNPVFTQYLFRSFVARKEIVKIGQGSTRFNLSKIQLMKLALNIPTIEEQKMISNFLSSVDNRINNCQNQIDQTEVWKKGLLQKMFV